MFNISQILPHSYKAALTGVAVAAFCNVEVGAQEVRDCDHSPEAEVRTLVSPMESDVNFSSEEYKPEKVTISNKAKSSVKEIKENPIYKASGEKEVNKEEMSTLSFNLFIYIMDRFKED